MGRYFPGNHLGLPSRPSGHPQLIHKCHTAVASPHLPESHMPPTPLETFWKHSGRSYWSPGDISWRVGNKTSLSPSDSHPWTHPMWNKSQVLEAYLKWRISCSNPPQS